ncbi:MAG: succinate dehydrogenase [Dehalococcoidia bacterium]|jgi:succinate dehydrogenase/fumarate reductase cytochrome b subunit|nr:succinate dehydrogenase [Dehalococcoidia bacterium]MDP6229050.1 succinate dehydrogenase [Dehalococcoidia bacterium]MDP7085437.1 succinate dehydrogenase [Dehalococcoidia bacterium]MDP7202205.1 succinate dehydrogenase [Dehalococcoidia bacterium]MDP7511799.1 succinate dehydrogenase [Dehalococcoidia bacterium]
MTIPTTGIRERDPSGFWPWFFQRVSGLLLIFFLAVHIWMAHFSGIADVIDGRREELVLFDIVERRLAQGLFVFVDFSLLALVLFHGLNGVRNILLEWRPAAERRRPITAGLWLLGVATFAYGAWALLQFII